jgi:hypothetical protein
MALKLLVSSDYLVLIVDPMASRFELHRLLINQIRQSWYLCISTAAPITPGVNLDAWGNNGWSAAGSQ